MTELLRILVPMDDSDSARRAARHVADLARRGLPVEVHLLNVQPPLRGAAVSLIAQSELNDYHRAEGMQALAQSERIIEAAGLKAHLHVGVGDPGEQIVAFSERLDCQHIVMGTRGLGEAASLILGSVAHHVVHASELPVTLLRQY